MTHFSLNYKSYELLCKITFLKIKLFKKKNCSCSGKMKNVDGTRNCITICLQLLEL